MTDSIFRTRESTEEKPEIPEKPAEVTGIVDDPSLLPGKAENTLENWEIQNGKYGLSFLGIKEIGKVFPINAQFGVLDKYIKEEMGDYDKTPERWQEVLKELETEIGSEKLNVYDRMRKLVSLIRIIRKQNELKEKKKALLG